MHGYVSVDHGWWGMGIGMFIMLIVAVLALVGVFAIAKWMTGSSKRNRPDSSEFAEASLKERYAKGEIDQATYQRQLGEIRKD